MKPINHSTSTCTDVADILIKFAQQQRNGNDDARETEFDWLREEK